MTYKFAVLGTNTLGDGPLGATTNLLIATVPNQPLPVDTSIVYSGVDTFFKISWLPPLNNGANIDSFKVNISVSGVFAEYPLFCDGSSSVATFSCQIHMSTVTSTLGY